MREANAEDCSMGGRTQETSPHAWSKRKRVWDSQEGLRNISTCVEQTTDRWSTCFPYKKHLHMRGANTIDFGLGRILSSSGEQQKQFITSTLMEEAIASSNMEGAATTRKEAKKMLRSMSSPRTKGALMILNNYKTIEYLSKHRNDRQVLMAYAIFTR